MLKSIEKLLHKLSQKDSHRSDGVYVWKKVIFYFFVSIVIIISQVVIFMLLFQMIMPFGNKISPVALPWVYFFIYLIDFFICLVLYRLLYKAVKTHKSWNRYFFGQDNTQDNNQNNKLGAEDKSPN